MRFSPAFFPRWVARRPVRAFIAMMVLFFSPMLPCSHYRATSAPPPVSAEGRGEHAPNTAPERDGEIGNRVLPEKRTLHHIINIGQSNAVGGGGDPALSLRQPFGNLKLSLDFETFLPLTEPVSGLWFGGEVETHVSTMANLISAKFEAQHHEAYRIVASNSGVGSVSCAEIDKGGTINKISPFDHSMTAAELVVKYAETQGLAYRCDAIVLVHGQSDCWNQNSHYGADLTRLWGNYNSELNRIVGASQPDSTGSFVPMVLTQLIGSCQRTADARCIKTAQWETARSHPHIFLAGPTYQLPMKDRFHLTNIGYQKLGEMIGRAVYSIAVDKAGWTPLTPQSFRLLGNSIFIDLHVPFPPLKHDPNIAVAYNGFQFLENVEIPARITRVVFGSETLRIELDKIPRGTIKLISYAMAPSLEYPQGAGNIMDSGGPAEGEKYPTNNYLVAFQSEL